MLGPAAQRVAEAAVGRHEELHVRRLRAAAREGSGAEGEVSEEGKGWRGKRSSLDLGKLPPSGVCRRVAAPSSSGELCVA